MPHTEASTTRILVVEDDHAIRKLLTYLLESRYDLRVVSRFDDALRAADGHPFDLFLFDINLGETRSGVELLERLRRMPAYRNTPAVACTAYVLPHEQAHFVAAGFDGYMSKPFTRDALIRTINATLKRTRSSKDAGGVIRRFLTPPLHEIKAA